MCNFEDKIKPPSAKHYSNGVAVKATNESLLLDTALVLAISTAQRIFALKIRRTKNQAAISQDYLLGVACFARKRKILSQFSICHCEEQRSCDVAIRRSEMRLRLPQLLIINYSLLIDIIVFPFTLIESHKPCDSTRNTPSVQTRSKISLSGSGTKCVSPCKYGAKVRRNSPSFR